MKLSLITLFHNRREVSARFIDECHRLWTSNPELEFVWGDSLSSDGTRELLSRAPSFAKVRLFDDNPGFALGNNRLAEAASGDLLVFLNNDVLFCANWLEEILVVARARPDAILGNTQYHVATRTLHHAGIFFDARGIPFHYQPPPHSLDRVPWYPVPAVTGCCLALPAALFRSLGGFDTAYRNGYEDIDLCLRASARGTAVLCSSRSVLWHHVCASPGRHACDDANERRFLELHGAAAQRLSAWLPPRLPPFVSSAGSPILLAHESLRYYPPALTGYSEATAVELPVRVGTLDTVWLALDSSRLNGVPPLRLDPPSSTVALGLRSLRLHCCSSGRVLFEMSGTSLATRLTVGGDAVLEAGDPPCLHATGEDPQLLLSLPPEAVVGVGEGPLLLELELFLHLAPPSAAGLASPRRLVRPVQRLLVDLHGLRPGGVNGGIRPFVLALLDALPERPQGRELTLVVHPSFAGEAGALFPSAALLPLEDAAYEAGASASWAALHDLLYAPVLRSSLAHPSLPRLSLIADLLHRDYPEGLPETERFAREAWVLESLATSGMLQCNSQYVQRSLAHHYGVSPSHCCIIANAVQEWLGSAKGRAWEASRPYFLYPANAWPHKNHQRLLQAYAAYRRSVQEPWDLVLTGYGVESLAPASEGLHLEGWVPSRHLAALYKGASALVFPSLHEGFGIPVLEALSLGLPVLASSCTSLPEVGGDACLWFDPLDCEQIQACLIRMHGDASLRECLAVRGRQRAAKFRLESEAARLAELMEHVMRE